MTRQVKTSEIWQILRSRIPKEVLIRRYSDPVAASRFSALYDQAVVWLSGLLEARGTASTARKFLSNTYPNVRLIDMPAYELWSRKIFSHLRQNPSTAQTLIESDFNQFVYWSYDSSILRALASRQNVIIP